MNQENRWERTDINFLWCKMTECMNNYILLKKMISGNPIDLEEPESENQDNFNQWDGKIFSLLILLKEVKAFSVSHSSVNKRKFKVQIKRLLKRISISKIKIIKLNLPKSQHKIFRDHQQSLLFNHNLIYYQYFYKCLMIFTATMKKSVHIK